MSNRQLLIGVGTLIAVYLLLLLFGFWDGAGVLGLAVLGVLAGGCVRELVRVTRGR